MGGRFATRLDRLERATGARESTPGTIIYIPDNGRSDEPVPRRFGNVVVYDPANSPVAVRDAHREYANALGTT